MAVAARRDTHMTAAAYRPWGERRPGEDRGELLDGVTVLLASVRERHRTIAASRIKRPADLADQESRRALPEPGTFGRAVDDAAPIQGEMARRVPPLSAGDPTDPILAAEASSGRAVTPDCDCLGSLIVPQDEDGIEVPDRDDGHDLQSRGVTNAVRDVRTGVFP